MTAIVGGLVLFPLSSCSTVDRIGDRGKDLAQAAKFRVGVHDGRGQFEITVAGYGLGLNIGARIITPLTPGVLSPALPMPFADESETVRWEFEPQK